MQDALYRSQRIVFGLLLAAAGLYAGVLLMYSVGISPVLDSMQGDRFLHAWQTHDYFFHIRIRFLLAALGLFYVLALILLAKQWRSKTFALILLAFLLSAADIQVARFLQRPVNREIRLDDVGAQTDAAAYKLEERLFQALHLRQMFSIAAFGVLCVAAMLPHAPGRKKGTPADAQD